MSGAETSTSARTTHAHKISGLQFSSVIFNYNECLCLFIWWRLSALFIHSSIRSIFYEPFNYIKLNQLITLSLSLSLSLSHSNINIYIYIYIYIYICMYVCISDIQWTDIQTPLYKRGLKYVNCILCREVRTPPPTKKGVLSMILNCFRWWGSSTGGLGNVMYLFHCQDFHGQLRPVVVSTC